ncbi:alpha-amylase family glycosyl hydrolase [Pelagicoccus mobilis]|uniref:Alpha-amylase n=1 Tax=Pelagicoccus mobilis TaxID=415221 RepID=A0A934RWC7_9BACT|nr:alpha-amylase family glycosyl hydrolase [Pelagicoccus mobilis]MBK1876690.1 hypothetical protein [Pelagicoccus mobilis]
MRIAPFFIAAALVCPLFSSTVTVAPEKPISGEMVTISYDPTGGPLASSGEVFLYRGFNGWAAIAGPDQKMAWDAEESAYTFTYQVPEAAFVLDFVFRDGADNWDNNSSNDWHVEVALSARPDDLPHAPRLPETASRAGVMLQGFYWDVPAGNWYNLLASKAAELRNMGSGQGIDRIWFPPPSKSESGPHSMGYDPYDYYDLGQYDQKNTVRTRFGTQEELRAAIAAFREQGIVCMADIVLNHRSGGDWEANPNSGDSYWTDFSKVASGKMTWDYDDFHPSSREWSDEGVFAGFPDVAYGTDNDPGNPRYDMIEWGNWLMDPDNAGFDGGWRFDYVKGFSPAMIRDFREGTGNAFGIIECWDGIPMIEAYLRVCSGASAFDFPGYYTMRDVFNSATGAGDISTLLDRDRVLAVRNSEYAVTFAANHDTDEIVRNRILAYAYILTFEGYPCIFWKDYFDRGLADLGGQDGNGIKPLVWARGALAGGKPDIEVLKGDDSDLLIYGSVHGIASAPGYLVAINDHATESKSATVVTKNLQLRGKRLKCYAWYSYATGQNVRPDDVECGLDGSVSVGAPARGYAVYGPADLAAPTVGAGDFSRAGERVVLTVRNLIEGEGYSVEASATLGTDAVWEKVGELTGPANGVGSIEIDWDPDETVFWRVESL